MMGFWQRAQRRGRVADRCPSGDAVPRVLREAERIVLVEKWHAMGDQAAERLSGTSGLRTARLFPESSVIQVVALDGQVIGRVRRYQRRWVAVPADGGWGPRRRFRTRRRAVAQLGRLARSTPRVRHDPGTER
jgi:hypothetical protein